MNSRSVVLKNDIEEIRTMSAFLEEISSELNLSMENTFNINLAIEEAVTNIILYAYPQGEEHDFILSADYAENQITFRLIDSGKEFDPTARPDVDVTLPLEERPIGGLGIFFMRQIMKTVEYQRVDGKNILTMVKNLD